MAHNIGPGDLNKSNFTGKKPFQAKPAQDSGANVTDGFQKGIEPNPTPTLAELKKAVGLQGMGETWKSALGSAASQLAESTAASPADWNDVLE